LILALAGLTLVGCATSPVRPIVLDCPRQWNQNQALEQYQRLLTEYVDKNGRVDYRKLAQAETDKQQLDCFLTWASQVDEETYPQLFTQGSARTAFYLNAHNASVIRAVLEFYPIKKLSDIPVDLADDLLFQVQAEQLSINTMAERTSPADDWRIAFALAGPALSDAALAKLPFRGEDLDEQLDTALKNYLESCRGIQIDHARRRVLLGKLIYQRKEFFLEKYSQLFDDQYAPQEVSLISALIPWVSPNTQELLIDLVGYDIGPLKTDNKLNEVEYPDQQSAEDKENEEEFLPCPCR